MKSVLVILDGIVAKKLLSRMVALGMEKNLYDIVYMDDFVLPDKKPLNFTFYKFDPTSSSKLLTVLDKDIHTDALIVLDSKDETINTIKNIRAKRKDFQITVYDNWDLSLNDNYTKIYNASDTIVNNLLEKLPNVPVLAQNIGLRQGEIMEIKIPFSSTFAYRYIGSIEQKEWRIFGLYRNDELLDVRPTIVLRPNDIILVIGKPKILMQLYTSMTKIHKQFPMPFGHNIYLLLDLYIQNEEEVLHCIEETAFLHKKLKNNELIITITRPSTIGIVDDIKKEINKLDRVVLNIDYHNLAIYDIVKTDLRKYQVGMFVFGYTLFQFKDAIEHIIDAGIPIFKIGKSTLTKTQNLLVVVNDTKNYEHIAPVIFDVSSQLKTKIKLFNIAPIPIDSIDELIKHIQSLSKIFNQKVEIINKKKNPIRELRKQSNILQVLPLKKAMLQKGIMGFFTTNSDLLSFGMSKFNQLLIPVMEE